MSRLVFVMGCTGSGKSTFLNKLKTEYSDKHGYVEVGKILRAKYPPEFFNGQAAPKHTQDEAWNLCHESVKKNFNKSFTFIDGQPRSVDQVDNIFRFFKTEYTKYWLFLDASIEVRRKRIQEKYLNDSASLDLGLQRVTNDIISYHPVLLKLANKPVYIQKVNTEDQFWLDQWVQYFNA